jgi:hypothetical protein
MRIHEIITENKVPGWQETPERYKIPGGGEIIMGFRRDYDGEIDGSLFHYYDTRIDKTEPVFSVRVQNKSVYVYDELNPSGKFIGKDASVQSVKEYFLLGVAKYLDSFIKENKMNGKTTPADILKMCPGLSESMDRILEGCGLRNDGVNLEEGSSVNMSPYKDSIRNAETSKSKSAKNKVEQLFRP